MDTYTASQSNSHTLTHTNTRTLLFAFSLSNDILTHTLYPSLSLSLSLFIFLSLFLTDRRLFTVANSADDWVHEPIPNFAKDHDRSHVRRRDLQMTSCECVCVYTYICVFVYICVCVNVKSAYEGKRVSARMRTRESVSLRVTMRVIHLSDLEEERL